MNWKKVLRNVVFDEKTMPLNQAVTGGEKKIVVQEATIEVLFTKMIMETKPIGK